MTTLETTSPPDLDPRLDAARTALREVFGFDSFRPLQEDVIRSVLGGRDTLVVMPTGGGKSLCYQLPALVLDGLTVVVSPLIALMHDQVAHLRAAGAPAVMLNSALDRETYAEHVRQVRSGEARLLYLAPETLLMERTQALLADVRVACLTVDEAHCISEWGHDFRPEYRQLAEVRARFPSAVCVALTATATERVRHDIQRSLGFADEACFVASFDRPNLLLQVVPKSGGRRQALKFAQKFASQRGIVYCATRRQTEELAAYLAAAGVPAVPYHAGLPDEVRAAHQTRFVCDDVDVVVATVAFGMGIDKPDVRFVLHYDLPKSVEGYYQEIGRAGRDGLPSECLLLFSPGDVHKARHFIREKSDPTEQRVAQVQLDRMVGYAEATVCRRQPLLDYFGDAAPEGGCGRCDNCLEPPEVTDVTVAAQKLLSCVVRTGQRFGAGHVVDVLRGSQGQKVLRMGHDRLSTYGIGGELGRSQWMQLARQLIQEGILHQDPEHGSVRLTSAARAVLSGEQQVQAALRPERSKGSGGRSRKGTPAEIEFHDDLFGVLRRVRKELADRGGVPPYVVFADRSLQQMAAALPTTEGELLAVHGVGQARLAKYGAPFLEAIRAWREEHGATILLELEPVELEPAQAAPAPRGKKRAGRRAQAVGRAYADGKSIAELVEELKIQERTLVGHLRSYHQGGGELSADRLIAEADVDPDLVERAFALLGERGSEMLRPVHEALGGVVSYPALSLLRLAFEAQEL